MGGEKTPGEDSVNALIKVLEGQGYEEYASMLEQSAHGYATTTSDKIVQILDALELVVHDQERFSPEVRCALQKTVSDLRSLLEQANNPWPWRFVMDIAHLFKK